jgi:integrase
MEATGSIREVADALGHKNETTTRVYAPKIARKVDRHAGMVLRRISQAAAGIRPPTGAQDRRSRRPES